MDKEESVESNRIFVEGNHLDVYDHNLRTPQTLTVTRFKGEKEFRFKYLGQDETQMILSQDEAGTMAVWINGEINRIAMEDKRKNTNE